MEAFGRFADASRASLTARLFFESVCASWSSLIWSIVATKRVKPVDSAE